jgi:hypothetical protein
MFECKARKGRVMVLCGAIVDSDIVRKRAIERSLMQLAERLETRVGDVSVSRLPWDFRSRFMLVAELPYQPDDVFDVTVLQVFSLPELDALRTLAAVDCDLRVPLADLQVARELASTVAGGRPACKKSNIRKSTLAGGIRDWNVSAQKRV